MASTQTRHDDVIIQRRFKQYESTRPVKQLYAVTYSNHTDRGTELESYGEAEKMALALASDQRVSVWFEENPGSARRTLLKDFRG